jgi:transcriptional regulator with AAA-type ATPase domain
LFRDDFFYRLCSDVITVPPLRQRLAEDIVELDDLLRFSTRRIVGEDSPQLVGFVHSVIEEKLGRDYSWPGNVRELEQAVRRILLTRSYGGDRPMPAQDLRSSLFEGIESGSYDAQNLLADYCSLLYSRHGTYEEVARRAGLDRRTAKKYVQKGNEAGENHAG